LELHAVPSCPLDCKWKNWWLATFSIPDSILGISMRSPLSHSYNRPLTGSHILLYIGTVSTASKVRSYDGIEMCCCCCCCCCCSYPYQQGYWTDNVLLSPKSIMLAGLKPVPPHVLANRFRTGSSTSLVSVTSWQLFQVENLSRTGERYHDISWQCQQVRDRFAVYPTC